MKYTINGETYTLNNTAVKKAGEIVSKVLGKAFEQAEEKNNYSFYFTLLVVMNALSQQSLNDSELVLKKLFGEKR